MTHLARIHPWRLLTATTLGATLLVAPATVQWPGASSHDSRAGEFDCFVLGLSWSPEHCAGAEARADEPQCSSHRPYGFVVHGLWPQSEDGPLDSCDAGGRLDPSVVDGMLDLMPSPALVRHEWRRHGTCSGMPPANYFAKVRAAHARVHIPDAFQDPRRARYVDAKVVRREFSQANPDFDVSDFAVICRQGHLREVRVCLDRELRPRSCGRRVRDQCRGEVAVRPIR
jgi:ribonuclease T2